MNTFRLTLVWFLFLCAVPSLQAQLIKDKKTVQDHKRMFLLQKQLTSGRSSQLFDVFHKPLSKDEIQALEYLYAYMPLSDLADYDGDFFLNQVKPVLKARIQLPWGAKIPEDVYLHFVLPPRVNNENLDLFRMVMYDELKKRISGLNMHDAALEINHWCHEKVTYRGSDDRTSSPLASVKTSFGRCGEESTFTVAAMRTMCIPARQVYTPRWAHSDDNHAWVEVWIDGKWNFIGACEPDAELNIGWFAEPARRAMLVHTRAYGAYFGSEPVIDKETRFAELNLISNYATAKQITVKVLSIEAKPVVDATIEYQLYNYAEFYPIAKGKTDFKGMNSIRTGLGDLLLWAYADGKFGYKKISVEKMDTIEIVLNSKLPEGNSENFDFIPPVEKTPLASKVSPNQQKLNTARLQKEDSIRNAYMSTFPDSSWVADFCAKGNYDFSAVYPLVQYSYGNWKEITNFITDASPAQKKWAILLLQYISLKDLRDTKEAILKDHLDHAFEFNNPLSGSDPDFFAQYIMNGRIANEMMLPWREFLQHKFGPEFTLQMQTDMGKLITWIKENIHIDDISNLHSRSPLSPQGVYELRMADSRSRDIFYVAVCRSLGFAARINSATNIPQYFSENNWLNIAFEPSKMVGARTAKLHFINPDSAIDPKYAVNFTIARFDNGVYRTIEFDYGTRLSEFDSQTEIEQGKYMLVTGNRQPDGSVLSGVTFFDAPENKITNVTVKIRQDFKPAEPWAKIDLKNYKLSPYANTETLDLKKLTENKGSILIWIDPDKEPSKHVMADIPAVRELIEKWNGSVIFLLGSQNVSASFKTSNFPNLPKQSIYVTDNGYSLLNEINRLHNLAQALNFPVIVVSDASGNLIYYSEGYKIGVGEQLAKALAPLR